MIHGTNQRQQFSGLSWSLLLLSFRLIACATVFSFGLGFLHAMYRTRLRSSWLRQFDEFLSTLLQSLPESMYVIIVFVVLVNLLRFGINLPGLFYDGAPRWVDTIAPAIALAIPGALYLSRILTTRLSDEQQAFYVDTARGKGVSEYGVFYRHVLPNILPMAFRQVPVLAGLVISNALFAEYFLGYMGVLFRLTQYVGWNDHSGAFGLTKPTGIPTYQMGAVFVVGLLLVVSWFMFALISTFLTSRFPEDIEPSPSPSTRTIDSRWVIAGAVCIGIVLFCSLFPGLLTTANPNATKLMDKATMTFPPFPPSRSYLLGSDASGHDLLAQTLHGTWNTLGQVLMATAIVVIGSIAVATIALVRRDSIISTFIRRIGRILSALPAMFLVFLAVYNRNLLSHSQTLQFVCWIALFEIGRGSVAYMGAMSEWYAFGFVEGAESIGMGRIRVLARPLRSWFNQFTLEFCFSEFTRILSLMTLLAMLHTYAVDKVVYLNGRPPIPAIRSGTLSWFSILGDAANNVFSILSHPFLIYAPVIALLLTLLGASFIARGLRGTRA